MMPLNIQVKGQGYIHVLIEGVCHYHRCLSLSQVFVTITGVCHYHRYDTLCQVTN